MPIKSGQYFISTTALNVTLQTLVGTWTTSNGYTVVVTFTDGDSQAIGVEGPTGQPPSDRLFITQPTAGAFNFQVQPEGTQVQQAILDPTLTFLDVTNLENQTIRWTKQTSVASSAGPAGLPGLPAPLGTLGAAGVATLYVEPNSATGYLDFVSSPTGQWTFDSSVGTVSFGGLLLTVDSSVPPKALVAAQTQAPTQAQGWVLSVDGQIFNPNLQNGFNCMQNTLVMGPCSSSATFSFGQGGLFACTTIQ